MYSTHYSQNYASIIRPTLACSIRIVELPNAAEILSTVVLQKRRGTQSENRCQMSDHCYVRTLYVWKAIPAEASKRGTPNMKLELQRVCSSDRSNAPPTSGNLYIR